MQKYLTFFLIFILSKPLLAAEAKQDKSDSDYYEFKVQRDYYENLKRARQQKTANIPANDAQYKGDFSKKWYREHTYKKNYYVAFNLGLNIAPSADDVLNSEITYTDGICRTNPGACAGAEYSYSPGETVSLADDTLLNVDYETALNVAAHFGLSYVDRYRIEGEFSYKQLGYATIDQSSTAIANYDALDKSTGPYAEPGPTVDSDQDITLNMTALMLNFYRDFNREGTYRPYIGIGFGGANVATVGVDQITPAYQAKIGMSYRLRENMFIDFGATYFDLGDVTYKYVIDNTNTSANASETVEYTLEHPLNFFSISAGYRFLFDTSY